MARAGKLLRELDGIRRSLGGLAGPGEWRAAARHQPPHRPAPPAGAAQVLPRHLATQVRLDLRFMDSEKACAAVLHGEIELAIVTLPPRVEAPLRAEKVLGRPARDRGRPRPPAGARQGLPPATRCSTPRQSCRDRARSRARSSCARSATCASACRSAPWPPATWPCSRCWPPSASAGRRCRAP
ncbi:MAG: hypothetical protein MZW92_29220 [Comamonadaceae bacterium]|nr:hypothetical protein [Comamonadaceae bacterium]